MRLSTVAFVAKLDSTASVCGAAVMAIIVGSFIFRFQIIKPGYVSIDIYDQFFSKEQGISSFIKFLAWLFVLLLMLEVFIRIFLIKSPYMHFVPELGVVPVDNSVSVWGVEGYGVTRFLANGEISTPQDSGDYRWLSWAIPIRKRLQVHDDQKFVSVAESILHERGQEMNLRNLGASGRCIADYVYIAPFVNRTYAPDVIVLQVI